MDFNASARIDHDADEIVQLMIQRMDQLAPHLPHVDAIETLERETLPQGRIRVVRRWRGNRQAAPRVIRPFVCDDSVQWLRTGIWNPDDRSVEWKFQSTRSAHCECSGVTSYRPHADVRRAATELAIQGSLRVHPELLPKIPKFLARRLSSEIETFVIRMITPSISTIAAGLDAYFGQWSGEGKEGVDASQGGAHA